VLTVPLFIGAYFIGKTLFRETALPKLQVLDNILGAIVGIVLALVIMALIYNTWGVAVSVRWQNVQTWNSMRMAYYGSFLRPYLREILVTSRPLFLMFQFTEYPPFFSLQR
jgi:CDP-diglyceride synthetase